MDVYPLIDPNSLRIDGSTPLTGNWDAGAFSITALNFISDVAIGTSPFACTSTTLNANLNADLLDGSHSSAFLFLDQTTPQDIVNGQPDFLAGLRAGSTNQLSIDASGNFLTSATGTFGIVKATGNGTIWSDGTTGGTPASGAGTRFMWIPAKYAFRAGFVDDTQWDNASIGNCSVAMGYSTIASGLSSVAMGRETTASGSYSVAMGVNTIASGNYSVAMGYSTIASGLSSVVMGNNTRANVDYSIALGDDVIASEAYTVGLGKKVYVMDTSSLGAEKITNGTFTGNANGWTLGIGWEYVTDKVQKNVDGTGTLSQTSADMVTPLIAGEMYKLSYVISSWTVGTVTPSIAGVSLKAAGANGTYAEVFRATSTADLVFTPTNTSRFYIDTISLKKITGGDLFVAGTVQAEQLTSTDDITMLGHLFSLGDNTDTNIIMTFDGLTNDANLTYKPATNDFDFGSSLITTTEPIRAKRFQVPDEGGLFRQGDITTGINFLSTSQFYFMISNTQYLTFTLGKSPNLTVNIGKTDINFLVSTDNITNFFRIDAGLDTLYIGDGGVTNFIQATATGNLSLLGSARLTTNNSGGFIVPIGTAPAPAVEGALFLDTDASVNGNLVIYSNGAWRTIATL